MIPPRPTTLGAFVALAFAMAACHDATEPFTPRPLNTPVLQLAGGTCVAPPSGLVAWWPGDTDASDIQGTNDGVLTNGASAGAPGEVLGAFSFDGVDDFVTFGDAPGNFGTSDFTIDFWIQTTSNRIEGVLGKRPICRHSSFWDIRKGANGSLTIELDQDASATNYNALVTTTAINDGNFHHVAVVRQGTAASVYIDGTLDGTGMTAGITNIVNSANLRAGNSACTGSPDGTLSFTGLLDELEIYNRALSASEIGDIFSAGCAGKCKPGMPHAVSGGPYNGFEGSEVAFDGSASSDPDFDPLTLSWDFGDPLDPTAGSGKTPSHTYVEDGVFEVRLEVTDPDGLTDTDATLATIANVPPTVGPIDAPAEPVAAGVGVTVGADFTDPGTQDTHSATIDWGDATVLPATVSETGGSGSVSGTHAYTMPGVHTVTVTVTDDDGGVGASLYEFVVVYDPSGGFVTGGGWIDSPEGAYKPDESLTGKATFGFVSKYLKGASTPTGNTEFHFKAGDLNFYSSSYEWLVVTGSDYARFKGSGTINGMGDYKFMLWAGDGSPDTFRIRIWEEDEWTATETDVYDNGLDQPIGGGSIVVHTK